MRTRFPMPPGPVLVPVNVQWKTASRSSALHLVIQALLHICDLYDTAFCLRVLWILHHRHVQFFLAFAERDVGCAITRGDLKYVQKLALRRYLQNLAAEP